MLEKFSCFLSSQASTSLCTLTLPSTILGLISAATTKNVPHLENQHPSTMTDNSYNKSGYCSMQPLTVGSTNSYSSYKMVCFYLSVNTVIYRQQEILHYISTFRSQSRVATPLTHLRNGVWPRVSSLVPIPD